MIGDCRARTRQRNRFRNCEGQSLIAGSTAVLDVGKAYSKPIADKILDLVGSRGRPLIDRHFAEDVLFVRTLAGIRPSRKGYSSQAQNGALQMAEPNSRSITPLSAITSLQIDPDFYRSQLRSEIPKPPDADAV